MPYLHAISSTISARFGTEFVLLVALAGFVVHERWCPRRGNHARCAVEVLVPIAAGVFVVSATLSVIAPSVAGSPAPETVATPSTQAALLTFMATFLSAVYGWRAMWSWVLALLCGAAQVLAGHAGPAQLLQGWFIGGGLGLALFAAVRPLRASSSSG